MGCLIVSDYASKYPDAIKSLILVSPPFLRPADLRKLPDKFYTKSYSALKNHTEDPIVNTIAGFISKISSFDHRSFNTKAFKQCMENIILNSQNWHTINKIKLPTCIIHGRFDPLVIGANLRTLAKQNRHITLIQSLGGHDVSAAKRAKLISELKNTMANS